MKVVRLFVLARAVLCIAGAKTRQSEVLNLALALIRTPWRGLLVLLLLLGAAMLLAVTSPEVSRKRLQLNDTSSIAVFEQMERARSIGSVDLLLIGDSSCLMGIDVDRLSKRLGKSVGSLCSIGYLGPAGYGLLLQRFAESGGRYKELVLAMHPDSLIRDPSWDYWVEFVRSGGPKEASGYRDYVATGLHFAERTFLWPLVRFPMQGRFGLYYGSMEHMRADVRASGTMIEPWALEYSTVPQFLSHNSDTAQDKPQAYCNRFHQDWPNTRYFDALQEFRKTLDVLGTHARFLLTVRPSTCTDEVIETHALAARSRITGILESPPDALATAPDTLPSAYFASVTHLNRFGREIYTDKLAQPLASLLSTSE